LEPTVDLKDHNILVRDVHRNMPTARLYENAIARESSAITSTGALATNSGSKTGRSPKDKRIVELPTSKDDINWGDINIKLDEYTFLINRQRGVDFLNSREYLYVIDGFAGWDPRYRINVRVICARAYHALFMQNMLIRPTREELAQFGRPDLVIYNAGQFPANTFTTGMGSSTSIDVCFERGEMVILGTEYAGEMKKGVFTVMNYLMPKRGVLSMHCSANEGPKGDVSLFFGLSGTGKTTLSADPHRNLIGDDEHCWSDEGIFNIEGGCYAKCAGLSPQKEPEIYGAIRFGAVLENVVFNRETREVDFNDISLTENTRTAYPLESILNAKMPALGDHPKNIILLTCDAFGVLPPVSRLTRDQAMYHFVSGYTAKIAGTEQGVTEPQATFSACFGAAFMVWHPSKYATMLAERMAKHGSKAWLVNTGWSGGAYGVGKRMDLDVTRAIIDAIHSGVLDDAPTQTDPVFGLAIPTRCPGVPEHLLIPANTWRNPSDYQATAKRVAQLFVKNFEKYAADSPPEIKAAGPRL
jgi:phosphoenolpyruvate carboxykinase (ATP)